MSFKSPKRVCSVNFCESSVLYKELCSRHYHRNQKHGTTGEPPLKPKHSWLPGYEGEYTVSPSGEVTSYKNIYPKTLSWKIGTDGYPRVAIAIKGKGYSKWMMVHRLILETYAGPCPEGMEGRHLEWDPMNPHKGNLAWGTHSENMLDKRIHGTDHNATKTQCIQGHPYNEKNTIWRVDRPGQRSCRACIHSSQAKKRQRDKKDTT